MSQEKPKNSQKTSATAQSTQQQPPATAKAVDLPTPEAAAPEEPENEMEFDFFILPRRIDKALTQVYEYLQAEEEADFLATPKKERHNHIWRSLVALRAWRTCPQGRLRR
jgi:hypothetical protein